MHMIIMIIFEVFLFILLIHKSIRAYYLFSVVSLSIFSIID